MTMSRKPRPSFLASVFRTHPSFAPSRALVPLFASVLPAVAGAQSVVAIDSPDPEVSSGFGTVVVLDGGTMIVSSYLNGNAGLGAGEVYAYERQPGSGAWALTQTIQPPPSSLAWFGMGVGLDGDDLVLTSYPRDFHRYRRIGGTWLLLDSGAVDPGSPYFARYKVEMDGNSVAMYDMVSTSSGVHIYDISAPSPWSPSQTLYLEHVTDVSISGDLMVVATSSAFYWYEYSGSWLQGGVLSQPTSPAQGLRCAVEGTRAVTRDTEGGVSAWELSSTGWSSVDSVQLAAHGYPYEGDSLETNGVAFLAGTGIDGACTLFTMGSDEAVEVALRPPLQVGTDSFGWAIASEGSITVVGAPDYFDGSIRPGRLYVFDFGIGNDYCANPATAGGFEAALEVWGDAAVDGNHVMTRTTDLPPNTAGMTFYGSQAIQVPYQSTQLCVTGGATGTMRLPVRISGPAGEFQYSLDLTAPPSSSLAFVAGSTWYFQTWFRDPDAGWRGHLSHAVEVVFE